MYLEYIFGRFKFFIHDYDDDCRFTSVRWLDIKGQASVTRLVDFWKLLVTKFLTKVAAAFGDL